MTGAVRQLPVPVTLAALRGAPPRQAASTGQSLRGRGPV